jgi:4-hydroxyphenylpyruvate dioxygenase
MKPCISQVTTLAATFADDVTAYSGAGWHGIEIWLTKLETHLEQHSAVQTRRLLADNGLTIAAAAYQGGLLQDAGSRRQVHIEHFRRRLDIAQALGIPTLIIAEEFPSAIDGSAVEEIVQRLRQAAQWAAGSDVRLALEFLSSSKFCNNLQTALALVAATGEPNLGVNLDVFHFHAGPSKTEDLDLLTADNLAHVQACDVAGGFRELVTDADRILPGDGDLNLEGVVRRLQEIGYNGWVSVELMIPALWRMPPGHVAELARQALDRFCRESGVRPTPVDS